MSATGEYDAGINKSDMRGIRLKNGGSVENFGLVGGSLHIGVRDFHTYNRYGVLLDNGGNITNDGTISGEKAAIAATQGSATVANNGYIGSQQTFHQSLYGILLGQGGTVENTHA